VSRDVRGDNYGKLEGYWMTEIGPLNQVMHMWSYESFEERAKLRGELAKNPRWTGEYIPLLRRCWCGRTFACSTRCGRRLPRRRAATSMTPHYRAKVLGGLKQWCDAFTAVLPAREKYSKIVVSG